MEVVELVTRVIGQVWLTLVHNWPFLVVSILLAAAMKLYLKTDVVAAFIRRHQRGGVLVATAAAVGTPLCSCGTTAVVLGMMAGSIPWAPIIAFMVASPLTSPEELIYSAGLFGWPFAIAFFGASIVLGLAGGAAGTLLDARGWLRNQNRFDAAAAGCECEAAGSAFAPTSAVPVSARSALRPASAPISLELALPDAWTYSAGLDGNMALAANVGDPRANLCCPAVIREPVTREPVMHEPGTRAPVTHDGLLPLFAVAPTPCACGAESSGGMPSAPVSSACSCGEGTSASELKQRTRFEWRPYLAEVAATSRRLLPMFLGFVAIGYLINDLIPAAWITALFGSGHAYSVPLAATFGLPFYLNTEASLPLVRGMLDAGMSSGAALAFLITGAGTSIGAIAGAMTIARWRVVGLVIATLWVGAVVCGFAFDALAVVELGALRP